MFSPFVRRLHARKVMLPRPTLLRPASYSFSTSIGNRFSTFASTPNGRFVIGLGGIGGVLAGGIFINNRYPGFYPWLLTHHGFVKDMSIIAGLIGVGFIVFVRFGPKKAGKMIPFIESLQDNRINKIALNAFRDRSYAVHEHFQKDLLLGLRKRNMEMMIFKLLENCDTKKSITFVGGKETGKTILSIATAKELSKRGYPCLYFQGSHDPDTFIATVFDVFKLTENIKDPSGFMKHVSFKDIRDLFFSVCGSINEPNIIIIDQLNKDSAYLKDIEELARRLTEKSPKSVVALVTSDFTDLFEFKKEARRQVSTVWPFAPDQLKEYIVEVCNVDARDADEALDVILTKFTPSLIKIFDMMKQCKFVKYSAVAYTVDKYADNQTEPFKKPECQCIKCRPNGSEWDEENRKVCKIGRLDFDAVNEWVKKERAETVIRIRDCCFDADENVKINRLKALQKLVADKTKNGYPVIFGKDEWNDAMGSVLTDPEREGYNLLKANDFFLVAEEGRMIFHSAVFRDACKEIIQNNTEQNNTE